MIPSASSCATVFSPLPRRDPLLAHFPAYCLLPSPPPLPSPLHSQFNCTPRGPPPQARSIPRYGPLPYPRSPWARLAASARPEGRTHDPRARCANKRTGIASAPKKRPAPPFHDAGRSASGCANMHLKRTIASSDFMRDPHHLGSHGGRRTWLARGFYGVGESGISAATPGQALTLELGWSQDG